MDEWVAAIVPAGGCGTRMGNETPKQFLQLGDVPLFVHALRVFESSRTIAEIVVVVPHDTVTYCQNELLPICLFQNQQSHRWRSTTTGFGVERVAGSRRAYKDRLVHDAVRPFVTDTMVESVIDGARTHGAAIVAIPLHDTVKRAAPDGMIETTLGIVKKNSCPTICLFQNQQSHRWRSTSATGFGVERVAGSRRAYKDRIGQNP